MLSNYDTLKYRQSQAFILPYGAKHSPASFQLTSATPVATTKQNAWRKPVDSLATQSRLASVARQSQVHARVRCTGGEDSASLPAHIGCTGRAKFALTPVARAELESACLPARVR